MPEAIGWHRPSAGRKRPRRSRASREKERERVKKYCQWYAKANWRKLRAWVLNRDPLCRLCLEEGIVREATEVDHIIPRRERPDLSFDLDNLQALCKPHHSQKTAREMHRWSRGDSAGASGKRGEQFTGMNDAS